MALDHTLLSVRWQPGPLWLFPLPQAEASDEGLKIRHHWRDSRGIAAGTWQNSKKGLAGMLPSMTETLGPLYSCKRGVLWRWWRNLTSKVSKLLFTSTVLELLDTPLYIQTLYTERSCFRFYHFNFTLLEFRINIWSFYHYKDSISVSLSKGK